MTAQERDLVQVLGKSGSVTEAKHSPIVAGLIAKQAELAGVIVELQHQIDQHRADLSHIDGVLRILATDLDPETIRPKRPYRRTLYFERRELSRLTLAGLRDGRRAADPRCSRRAGIDGEGFRLNRRDPARGDSPSGRIDAQTAASWRHS